MDEAKKALSDRVDANLLRLGHPPVTTVVRSADPPVRDYSKGFNDRCDVCGTPSKAGVCRGCESEGLG